MIIICDPAWENNAYVHTTFLDFEFQSKHSGPMKLLLIVQLIPLLTI